MKKRYTHMRVTRFGFKELHESLVEHSYSEEFIKGYFNLRDSLSKLRWDKKASLGDRLLCINLKTIASSNFHPMSKTMDDMMYELGSRYAEQLINSVSVE